MRVDGLEATSFVRTRARYIDDVVERQRRPTIAAGCVVGELDAKDVARATGVVDTG